jgi:hypothetical protein
VDLHAKYSCSRACHQTRVAERREINQPDTMFVTGDYAVRDR